MTRAFSLVELSIVLVILGLLVGGVLNGQSLIHAAELRSVSRDAERFTAANYTFKDKYFAMAGDMTNATQFWGIAAGSTGSDSTCYATATDDSKTCNGSGDGLIGASGANYEFYLVWKHLANASLIEGSYKGTNGLNFLPGMTTLVAGVNMPASKISSSGMWVETYITATAGTTTAFATTAGNALSLATATFSGVLSPTDEWNLDTKVDDGRPQSGKVTSTKGNASNPCASNYGQATSTDATATYNFAYTAATCTLTYQL